MDQLSKSVNPRILERTAANPKRWGKAAGKAYHHMIPAGMLQEVWNRLVDQHVNSVIPEAGLAIRGFLLLCCSHAKREFDIDNLIDRIRAQESDQKRAGHAPVKPLDEVEVYYLQTAVIWPPWNAVEGPENRADDPNKGRPGSLGRGQFRDQDFDSFTLGLSPQEAARVATIEMLFRQFKAFLESVPGPESLRSLAKAASHARPILACDFPIRFNPEMWVKDTAGWRKRHAKDKSSAATR